MEGACRSGRSPFRGWRSWARSALVLAVAFDAVLMFRIATARSHPPPGMATGGRASRTGQTVAGGGTDDRPLLPVALDSPEAARTNPSGGPASPPEFDPPVAGDPRGSVDPAALAALVPPALQDALVRIASLSAEARERAMRMLERRLEGSARERAQLLSLVLTLEHEPSLDVLAQALLWRLEIPASPGVGTEQMLAILHAGAPKSRRRAAAVALRRYCLVAGERESESLLELLRREEDPGILSDLGFALVNRSDPIPAAARRAHADAIEEVAARIPGGQGRRRMLVEAWSRHETESGPLESDLEWLQRVYRRWSVCPMEMREDAAAAFATLVHDHRGSFTEQEGDPAVTEEVLSLHVQVYRATASPTTRRTLIRSALSQGRESPRRDESLRSFLSAVAAVETDPRRAQVLRRLADSAGDDRDVSALSELWRALEADEE